VIYPYECNSCKHEFEVTKTVKNIDLEEKCSKCDSIATRYIAYTQSFSGEKDWNQLEWNPAFGKALTPRQAAKEAKRQGLIELGTEPIENIHKHHDAELKKKLEYKI